MALDSLEGLSSVIDHHALLTRCLNNLAFAERMLTLFQARCGEELTELEKAFEKGDLDSVRRISHRLTGASANAAASGLQARASDLRHAADDGSLDKASECLVELRREWHRLTDAMAGDERLSSP